MKKKIIALALCSFFVFLSACNTQNNVQAEAATTKGNNKREIVLMNDNTNEERNRLLKEDIEYFAQTLPKSHKNPFSKLSKEEFTKRTNELAEKVDELKNLEVFTSLGAIVAAIGDAHTSINYWDGYKYPLRFWIFGEDLYIINVDKSLESLLNTKVMKINGMDSKVVMEKLTQLIPYENESWVKSMLPDFISSPVYLYGLGLISDESATVFTVEKEGEILDVEVPTLSYGQNPNYSKPYQKSGVIGDFDKYYDYHYLPEDKTLYFEYNACADMQDLSFKDFNEAMFKEMNSSEIEKIIIDLRSNSGGNSEILNPFTKNLKSYVKENPDVQVYTLVGRSTFSSGMFAIYRIKEAVPKAISVGEPTGGSIDGYGEIKNFSLPNSQIPITYSTKYFEFSKSFSYKNEGTNTFIPDVLLESSMEDYLNDRDVCLEYVLEQ